MFGSMQKPHNCGFFCHLSRPVFSQRPDGTRQTSGHGRRRGRQGNVKNEGLMQKTNHQMLMMNVICGNIQA